MKERRNELKTKFLKAIIREEEKVRIGKNVFKIVSFIAIVIVLVIFSIISKTVIGFVVAICLFNMTDIFEEVQKDGRRIFSKHHIQLEDISIRKIILGNRKCIRNIESMCIWIMVIPINEFGIIKVEKTPNIGIDIIINIMIIIVIVIFIKVLDIISKKVSKYYMYDCLKEEQESEEET